MHAKHLSYGFLIAAVLGAVALSAVSQSTHPKDAPTGPPPKTSPVKSVAKQAIAAVDEGDRVFQQHCSRCHNAPEGFSPRISGTIVRHMRVRASLSQHEEEELLRFLNP
jgi:cytochrome c5